MTSASVKIGTGTGSDFPIFWKINGEKIPIKSPFIAAKKRSRISSMCTGFSIGGGVLWSFIVAMGEIRITL